jgi:hypothetical protein
MGKLGDLALLIAVGIGAYFIWEWFKKHPNESPFEAKPLGEYIFAGPSGQLKTPEEAAQDIRQGPWGITETVGNLVYRAFTGKLTAPSFSWPKFSWPTTWGVSGKPLGTVGQEPSYPSTGQKYEWITRERF